MFIGNLLLVLQLVLPFGSRAQYAPDEVTVVPGMKFQPNYRHWSGYLQTRPGSFLHYW